MFFGVYLTKFGVDI